MKHYRYGAYSWVMIITFCFFCAFTFLPSSGRLNASNDDVADKLNKAEDKYYDGDLDTALALVLECLRDSTISNYLSLRANKLLAHILLNKEESEAAKNALFKVLNLEPNYRPTIEEEAPRFVTLVEEARREFSEQKVAEKSAESGTSNWIWIGAGGAVVAAAVILLSGNGSGTDQKSPALPQPPDLP